MKSLINQPFSLLVTPSARHPFRGRKLALSSFQLTRHPFSLTTLDPNFSEVRAEVDKQLACINFQESKLSRI